MSVRARNKTGSSVTVRFSISLTEEMFAELQRANKRDEWPVLSQQDMLRKLIQEALDARKLAAGMSGGAASQPGAE